MGQTHPKGPGRSEINHNPQPRECILKGAGGGHQLARPPGPRAAWTRSLRGRRRRRAAGGRKENSGAQRGGVRGRARRPTNPARLGRGRPGRETRAAVLGAESAESALTLPAGPGSKSGDGAGRRFETNTAVFALGGKANRSVGAAGIRGEGSPRKQKRGGAAGSRGAPTRRVGHRGQGELVARQGGAKRDRGIDAARLRCTESVKHHRRALAHICPNRGSWFCL